MSVPEVDETNISCEAGMEESFPGASAPKGIKGEKSVNSHAVVYGRVNFYQKKF